MENENTPAGETPPKRRSLAPATREDRLKAALKANMARRKAQARARQQPDAEPGAEQDRD
ncbi:hypothetical protein [Falsirhodobacter sp. 20TX0035]|uniref:hypothetical protein n=1 Tax=Falsirhodobacter sp. 20TX0035 TaxID=3022019 RepID=UPI002331486D|nr:hypothetical protein [Falsirhodobacter sp. 20TX0035]MDB6453637.1 hypothetical protein [Falsirhodobacter sp. 20TX0035]